jgi:hypothetical protein
MHLGPMLFKKQTKKKQIKPGIILAGNLGEKIIISTLHEYILLTCKLAAKLLKFFTKPNQNTQFKFLVF